jgi:hypothetical protein
MALIRCCSGVGVVTSVIFIASPNLRRNADYIRGAKLGLKYFGGKVGIFSKYDCGYNYPTCSYGCAKLFHTDI